MEENSLINKMYDLAKDVVVYSLPFLGAGAISLIPGSLIYSTKAEARKMNLEKIKTNQLLDEVDVKSKILEAETNRVFSDLRELGSVTDYEPESSVPDAVTLDKYGFSPEEIREHSRARGTEPHPLDDLVWEKITQGNQK
ncbi:hypothetical protein ACFLZB_04145 [Nanoarchaeota archaeon]